MAEVVSAHSMLTAYDAIAVRCWEDPDARERIAGAPRETLEAYGWEVPDDVRVAIEFVDPDPGARQLSAEEVVTVWRREMDEGELRIRISGEPPALEAAELSDTELQSVAAGSYLAPTSYPP